MHNLHAGLTQVLAEQRITELLEQAGGRGLGSARPPRRRREHTTGRWWQLVRWPVSA